MAAASYETKAKGIFRGAPFGSKEALSQRRQHHQPGSNRANCLSSMKAFSAVAHGF